MNEFNSVDDILDFAISNEIEAHDFYISLAENTEHPEMKKTFEQFATEEEGHKKKIMSIKEGKKLEPSKEKVMDLKISDYLVDITPTPDMSYQEALIVAMKKEKSAYRMYSDLSQKTNDESLRDLFQMLAQEEAKHKLRFEIEYDENVMADN